jgi:hypothetical protein
VLAAAPQRRRRAAPPHRMHFENSHPRKTSHLPPFAPAGMRGILALTFALLFVAAARAVSFRGGDGRADALSARGARADAGAAKKNEKDLGTCDLSFCLPKRTFVTVSEML